MKLFAIVLVLLLTAGTSSSQSVRLPLTHDLYDSWNDISGRKITNDGRWASWEVNPQQGDGWLYLMDLNNYTLDSVSRGHSAVFSPNSNFIVFNVKPPAEVLRKARREGKSAEEMPQDSVGIYVFGNPSNTSVRGVKKFELATGESDWMVYVLRGDMVSSPDMANLYIFNPITRETFRFRDVSDFSISDNGRLVTFIRVEKTEGVAIPDPVTGEINQSIIENTTVSVFNTGTKETIDILGTIGKARSVIPSPDGTRAAFLFSSDNFGATSAQPDIYRLWYWQDGDLSASEIVSGNTPGMTDGWSVSEHSTISFNENSDRLFFGTAPQPGPAPDDSTPESEKHRLDIWHYLDPLIQPQQLVELPAETRRTYAAVYHIDLKRMVQLGGPDLPEVTTSQRGDGRFELGATTLPYRIRNSFESGNYADIYLIDVISGGRRMVLEMHRGSSHLSTLGEARLSPGGNYLLWYSQADSNWYSMHVNSSEAHNITGEIPVPLYNELHDQPSAPGPYGTGTWTEDDSHVLIYDRFDIWKADPSGTDPPECLTNGYGRANNIRLRYINPEPGEESPGTRDQILLSAFNFENMQSGFYSARTRRPGNPSRLIMNDAHFIAPLKAKDANVLLWQRSTFTGFPDLWVSNMNFRNPRKISHANPRQKNYKWGTAELVEWTSFDEIPLKGILYKPEEMEAGKKYPMIVYFYERLSHTLHNHYVPAPSRSTINITWCTSNDYIVFVPDIAYKPGYPGQSAYNAVVSGTEAMLESFDYIDRENIGIQGQSWAGYQITWLITRTDLFRAAMAGAPVTNMISAYGGIRWRTGFSRIYQYEETQSRIGGTLWEKPELYRENSPIFFADRVNTPLLIMHNDNDGAVPWTQGIEIYMALRRLGKPVWMLNYNGEEHNLQRRPNMMDLSVRMYQFFDHYLKGSPSPLWLKEGVPAIEKGKTDGYELIYQ